ncbi:MAG TPA: hypothetical protein VK171_13715, partial [Fimbriimonas sp.]|nr:hypothetical protein [Fimbriimonas sp.]
ATSGVAALVSLLVEADGENRTRSAVSKLEKYEGLLQSSLQEDAERGTAVAASALEKLGFEKTIGTKRLTYSTMEQLPGLYDLKGTIQSVTVRLGTKLNVPKAKNPQKPSVKELDVTYLRDEYNAQWEAPNTTSFNLLERDSSPATGWVENIKSGTSSISTLSAPLELFERMANAKSTKDREKIPQLQTPSAEQTPFKARELSQHFRVNLELPDGHQWQQEAPMLGDLIRVLKLDLGPVGKVSVFNLDERLEGPLSKTQFLTTEVLGFGKLMGLAGCDEDVAVVRYSIDSEPADPIYSTSDDGQLVPVWKYLLKYATSGTAVVGCKSGFTYFQEFKSADQAVTFSVTSKEPSQSKLTEIRTDKERSLWMDWHEQQYGSESLVKVVGTEVAIDRYRAMQKAVPGSEIDWLIRSGFLSHLVHLDQAERSKLEVALTTIALDLANRGHLASATSLIMPTILDGSISLLYHSDPDKQTTRDRLLRDILETQYSRLSYNNLASWQTADSTLPEDCRVWNFIAAKRYNEIYSSAAQLRANFSSSDKDRIENATRFFYEFANDPNAFGPVYRVLSHRTKETYDTLDSNDISKALVVHSDSIGKMSERDEALRIVMDVLLERADLPADEVVQLLNLALIKTSLPSEFRISLIRKGLASYGSSEQMVNLARTELREQSKADLQYLLLEELINIQPTQSEAELALTLAAQKRDKSVSLKAANCLLSMSDDTATLTKVAGALKASCKPTELYGMISTFVGEDSSVENLMVLTELAIEAKSLTQAASIITTLKAKGADVAKLQLKYDAASPEKKKTSASQTSENKASNKSGKGGG